jgi:Ca2+/H+ antiporter, TMEM165/GDT1 family
MLAAFFLTYGAVFAAEIVGDKLLYTAGILATRYRARAIVAGVTVAFMAKMAVAVALGAAIGGLPRGAVAAATAFSFLGLAYSLSRPIARAEAQKDGRLSRGGVISFGAVFLSEWGDAGQLTAAMMATRFGSPSMVWLGAVGAMATKGALAASLGAGVRHWIHRRFSPRLVRYAGVSLMLLLGTLSVVESLYGRG